MVGPEADGWREGDEVAGFRYGCGYQRHSYRPPSHSPASTVSTPHHGRSGKVFMTAPPPTPTQPSAPSRASCQPLACSAVNMTRSVDINYLPRHSIVSLASSRVIRFIWPPRHQHHARCSSRHATIQAHVTRDVSWSGLCYGEGDAVTPWLPLPVLIASYNRNQRGSFIAGRHAMRDHHSSAAAPPKCRSPSWRAWRIQRRRH